MLRREFEEQQIAMGKALALSVNEKSSAEEKEISHSKDSSSESVDIAADVGLAKSEAPVQSTHSDDDRDAEGTESGVFLGHSVAGGVDEVPEELGNARQQNTVQ